MSEFFVPRVGGVMSADIAVPEHEREMRFYARVLSTGNPPLWREDLTNNLGTPIIGLGPRSAAYDFLPLQWMPHIQVADVAAGVERALKLGGSELAHGKDDEGNSQWAVLLDPNGAAFGLIPVPSTEEISPEEISPVEDTASSIGCIAWLDLTVTDATATRDFYREVVGWSVEDVKMEDAGQRYADFNMLGADGKPAAGICHARGVNAEMPPVWMLYLPVGDLPESLRRVEEEGGMVVKTTRGADGNEAISVVQDPVGVYLALASE